MFDFAVGTVFARRLNRVTYVRHSL